VGKRNGRQFRGIYVQMYQLQECVYKIYITVYRLIYKPLIIQSDVIACLCFRKRWPRQGRLMFYYIPGSNRRIHGVHQLYYIIQYTYNTYYYYNYCYWTCVLKRSTRGNRFDITKTKMVNMPACTVMRIGYFFINLHKRTFNHRINIILYEM